MSIVERLGEFWCCKITNIFSFRKRFGITTFFFEDHQKQSHFTKKEMSALWIITLDFFDFWQIITLVFFDFWQIITLDNFIFHIFAAEYQEVVCITKES